MANLAALDELNREIISCRLCPRLVDWREETARIKRRATLAWDYWGKPVPGFGDPQARILVVGLAPGAHGSNRTGRMFTGDASGDFLYPALHRASFASQSHSHNRQDDLTLHDLYITAICRCAPPANKPALLEMANCRSYLLCEMDILRPRIYVVLGRVAFENLLRIFSLPVNSLKFVHAAHYPLPVGGHLLCSYHPSRQNTQTGKLSPGMFDQVWMTARKLLVE